MPSIIRVVHKERPFLMIDKETIRDLASDLQALGLLVVLLAKPDDWRVRPEQLAKELSTTRSTIYRVLRRLITTGYIVREDFTRRIANGTFERRSCYSVYEDKHMVSKRKEPPEESFHGTRICGKEVPF
jgi:DNA-binding MarR family transcriptional regulator